MKEKNGYIYDLMGCKKLAYNQPEPALKVVYRKTEPRQKAVQWFLSIDPHAENYFDLSPFAYVANNPLIFTDPTGMDIEFGEDERFWFKVKAVATLAAGWLTSSTQRTQINQLMKSDNVHTIKESDGFSFVTPDTYSEYSSERPIPDPWKINDAEYMNDIDQKEAEWQEGKKDHMPHKDGTGDGSTIYLNLSKSGKKEGESHVTNEAHEFRHATEIDRGTINTDRIRGGGKVTVNGKQVDAYPGKHERNAIAAQNRVATQTNRFRLFNKVKLMKNYYEQVP